MKEVALVYEERETEFLRTGLLDVMGGLPSNCTCGLLHIYDVLTDVWGIQVTRSVAEVHVH